MKNSEIHTGLEKKEIRDFLALSLLKSYETNFNLVKERTPPGGGSLEWAIKDAENEIEFRQKCLQELKERAAVLKIIQMNGWEDFDISDETEKDLPYKLSMNFLGTKAEYDSFIVKLEEA